MSCELSHRGKRLNQSNLVQASAVKHRSREACRAGLSDWRLCKISAQEDYIVAAQAYFWEQAHGGSSRSVAYLNGARLELSLECWRRGRKTNYCFEHTPTRVHVPIAHALSCVALLMLAKCAFLNRHVSLCRPIYTFTEKCSGAKPESLCNRQFKRR